jgi:hypothetical protein
MRAKVSVPTNGIVHDLERQRRERRIVVGRTDVLGLAVELEALNGRHVERGGEVVDHASSRGCTPLFLNAEPHSTGTNEKFSVPLRISAFSVFTSARRRRDRPP